MWSLKNLVHSPATRKHVQQGARGLEDVSLGKEGGGGELYGILECSSDIEGKKVSCSFRNQHLDKTVELLFDCILQLLTKI